VTTDQRVVSKQEGRARRRTVSQKLKKKSTQQRILLTSPIVWRLVYEHSEQARAPHTNRPRNVPRRGALSLLDKTQHYRAGGGVGGEKN
jgi:hypothetical protein